MKYLALWSTEPLIIFEKIKTSPAPPPPPACFMYTPHIPDLPEQPLRETSL